MENYRTFAALIYVTEIERQAVTRMYNWEKFLINGDTQVYYKAAETKNGMPIIAAMQDEMGMTASATLTMKMIEHFKPKYVIMPGIAAGTIGDNANEQMYGDVVLADMVWNYSNGKYVPKDQASIVFGEIGFEPRPTVVKIDDKLIKYFNKAVQSEKNRPMYISEQLPAVQPSSPTK